MTQKYAFYEYDGPTEDYDPYDGALYLDGYAIDDRTFEGMEFELTLDSNQTLIISWPAEHSAYIAKFDPAWIQSRIEELLADEGQFEMRTENGEDGFARLIR